MATVPKCKFDLEVCGGTFVDRPCVIDGNLVSSRTFQLTTVTTSASWMKLLREQREEEPGIRIEDPGRRRSRTPRNRSPPSVLDSNPTPEVLPLIPRPTCKEQQRIIDDLAGLLEESCARTR